MVKVLLVLTKQVHNSPITESRLCLEHTVLSVVSERRETLTKQCQCLSSVLAVIRDRRVTLAPLPCDHCRIHQPPTPPMASVSPMSRDKQQKTEMSQRSKSRERKLSFDKALGFDMTTLKVQWVTNRKIRPKTV